MHTNKHKKKPVGSELDASDLASVAGGGDFDGGVFPWQYDVLASESCYQTVKDAGYAVANAGGDIDAQQQAMDKAWNGPACAYYGW
jgi:hypothetical protein